jgi:hypothetical protein
MENTAVRQVKFSALNLHNRPMQAIVPEGMSLAGVLDQTSWDFGYSYDSYSYSYFNTGGQDQLMASSNVIGCPCAAL